MKQAFAIAALFLGIIFESMLWDEQIMQSPDELTVSEFERAECGLSVVLTNAIEDARALVDYLEKTHDQAHRDWFDADTFGCQMVADINSAIMKETGEQKFRAMRLLGLLEATREREAGQVT